MKLPKLSLRAKIMGTIVLATALVVLIGAWKTSLEIKESQSLGTYLRKYLNRYLAAGEELGTSEYAMARLVSLDQPLAAALEAGDGAKVDAAVKRAADALQGTIAPELFVVTDAAGSL